jgi:hypothetical protein
MILNKESVKPTIDLTSPSGNAFALLGFADDLSNQLGMTKKESEEIQAKMKSSDYENLINIFDYYFGENVDLVR